MPCANRRPRFTAYFSSLGIVLGSLIVCFLMLLAYRAGSAVDAPLLVRYLAALAAALLSPLIAGKLVLHGNVKGTAISATAGFAMAVLVFLFWPGTVSGNEPRSDLSPRKLSELRGIVLNGEQHAGTVRLYFEEPGKSIITDPQGLFDVNLPPLTAVHIQIEGYSKPFELKLPPSGRSGFVRLDLARPGIVLAAEESR